jgi:hypothetical protein
MAVIKIVPMPGAEGQQGETGAVGPQGPQGDTGATGPAGADAVWYYNGEYNPGAAYVVGDVVTYDGQLWYRKNANGGNVGDTPSEGLFWDLLAAKGENGVSGTVPLTGTWDTQIAETSQIVGTGSDYENTKLGRYYVLGDLVFIEVNCNISKPLDWGNFGGFAGRLPFPISDWQTGLPSRYYLQGRYFASADADPVGVTDSDEAGNIDMIATLYTSSLDQLPSFALYATDAESFNTNAELLRVINPDWPINLRVPETTYGPRVSFRFTGVYRRETENNTNGLAESFIYKSGAVPPTHHGSVGDFKNDVRYDGTHLYICVEDYTDGTAIIWRRINWASGNW